MKELAPPCATIDSYDKGLHDALAGQRGCMAFRLLVRRGDYPGSCSGVAERSIARPPWATASSRRRRRESA